jgi:hypothetical protein
MIMVPLPPKLWLAPEPAERTAGALIQAIATGPRVRAGYQGAREFRGLQDEGRLTLRTYAMASNEFKNRAGGRLDPDLAREYRLARLSRYVMVVEVIDRTRRDRGEPWVLGEVVMDGTSSDEAPAELLVHLGERAWIYHTSGPPHPVESGCDYYLSGGVGPP